MKTIERYPVFICFECGKEYGKGMPEGHVCTVHVGRCDICGRETSVTEPRDFGHLDSGKIKVKGASCCARVDT